VIAYRAVDLVSARLQVKLHGSGLVKTQIGVKFLLNALALNLKIVLNGTIIVTLKTRDSAAGSEAGIAISYSVRPTSVVEATAKVY
jgi:hypothetical protein